jgi:16S rRNA (guanine527-N7)-methyltransferase
LNDERARLRAGAAGLGVPLDDLQAQRLLRLLDELAQWNRAYNLTAITDRAAMVTHHLLDSLAGSRRAAGARVLDLGTGAGFPGLPLALMHPAQHFTLLDGTAKKVRFVAHAARTIGLANVEAVHGRAGEWQPAAPFDLVLARAVATIAELARLARPLLAPGGRLLAWKGQRREAEAELAALRALAGGGDAPLDGTPDPAPDPWGDALIEDVRVPGLDAERCLVSVALRG